MKNRMKGRFNKLYCYILLLFLVVLIPSVLLGSYSYIHTYNAALHDAESMLERQITYAVQEVDKRMEDISVLQQVLASNNEVLKLTLNNDADAENINHMLNVQRLFSDMSMLNDSLFEVVLYTSSDKVVSASGIFPAGYYFNEYLQFEAYDLEAWKAFHSERGKMRFLPPSMLTMKTINRYSQHHVIAVISNIKMQQGRGLMLFVIDSQSIVDTLGEYIPYSQTNVVVYNDSVERVISQTNASLNDSDIEISHISAFNGWTYSVKVSRNEIASAANLLLKQVAVITFCVLIFGLLLVVLVSRRMYQPLSSIQTMLGNQVLQASKKQSSSLESMEEQVSQMMKKSSQNKTQLVELSRTYAESVFFSQTMSEKRVSLLENVMVRYLGFHGGPYQCAAIRFATLCEENKLKVIQTFKKHFPICSLGYNNNTMLFVLEIDVLHGRTMIEVAAQELYRDDSDEIIGIAIGDEVTTVLEINKSLNASLTVLQQLKPQAVRQLLFAEDFNISGQYIYTYQDEWTLIEAVQRNEGERLHMQLDEILLRNYEKLVSYQQIQHLFEQLRSTALRYAQQKEIYIPPVVYDALKSFDTSRTELHKLYSLLLQDTQAQTRHIHKQLITDADEYIHSHFQQDIYLNSIAEALNVSPKHLSRVYKQYRSINITDQITAVRVDHAKALLTETNLPVSTIMCKCGFMSRATFLRSFRKYVSISPSVYRSIHSTAKKDETQ